MLCEDIDQDASVESFNKMKKLGVVLVHALILLSGAAQANDDQLPSSIHLQLNDPLDVDRNMQLVAAIAAAAPAQPDLNLDEPLIEPAAPGLDESAWADGNESGVAYSVSDAISLGLAYELEEIEDLTAQHIEMGTAGVDYTSHKVLVRANWQFDLVH
jgi:hypothetical protein